MKRLDERLARARSEAGVTLIELVVVCAVMTVILGYVTRTLVVMQNASVGSSLRLQNLEEARVLMDLVTKDVRTASRMTSITSPFDVRACSATVPQPCAPSGWGSAGNPAPYVGRSELWFYANLTLANQTQASPCPDIVHLIVDSSVSPPVLREQVVSDIDPLNDAPPNCRYGSATAPYAGTYSTRLVGKYIVNGIPTCTTPDPVFVYWYDDAVGSPAAYPNPVGSLSAAQLLQVNAVGITFAVRQQTNFKVPCATLVNRVRLSNVDYNPIPSPAP